MALVPGTYYVWLEFIDSGYDTFSATYPMTATTDEDADTEALTVVSDWAAMTDAQLLRYHWYQDVVEDTIAPTAGSQVENQALLSYAVAGDPLRRATVSIPAPKITLFSAPSGPGSNIIDTGDALITTFNSLFLSGGEITFKDGSIAASLIEGKRIHRRSKKG